MPELSEITGPSSSKDSGRVLKVTSPIAPVSAPPVNIQPGLNPVLRCPIPPIWSTTPDSLRQFYNTGGVPQMRIYNPPINFSAGSGTTVVNNYASNIANTSSGSSSSSASSAVALAAISQVAVQTTVIPSGSSFVGSFTVGKAFQLLSIAASGPCRIQLYGTSLAQSGDFARGMDVPLQAGTIQNVITDLVLDTSPYQWSFQDRVGANADSPQTSLVYLTATNLAGSSATLTVTLSYVVIA